MMQVPLCIHASVGELHAELTPLIHAHVREDAKRKDFGRIRVSKREKGTQSKNRERPAATVAGGFDDSDLFGNRYGDPWICGDAVFFGAALAKKHAGAHTVAGEGKLEKS